MEADRIQLEQASPPLIPSSSRRCAVRYDARPFDERITWGCQSSIAAALCNASGVAARISRSGGKLTDG